MPDHYPATTNKRISVSKLMGRDDGVSKTGNLAGITKRVTIRLGKVEKLSAINAEKISKLKDISQSQSKRISGDTVGNKLPGGGGLLKSLQGINDNVNGMLSVLIDRQNFESKVANDERKRREKATRGGAEKKLESKAFDGIKGIAKTVMAPAMSLWERLMDFLKTILFGRIAVKLWEWFSDKENQKKVQAIGRFFKDWWPAMLTGFVLFGTGMGRFIAWMGKSLVKWGWTLLKTVIPVLWKAIAAMGPWGWAALALGGAAYMGSRRNDRLREADNQEDDESTVTPKEFTESRQDDDPSNDETPNYSQLMTEQVQQTGAGMMFNQGGQVPGSGNRVTVPAMLTPGEFVMSKGAVQQYGADTLAGMNAAAGGTNIPTIDKELVRMGGGELLGFAGGGLVNVKGSGDGSTGKLTMHDKDGKQQGGSYSVISGLPGKGDATQEERMNISGQGLPMPDGTFNISDFVNRGHYLDGPLRGLGYWDAFIGSGRGMIGNRSGLEIHSDIDPYGTNGCIGVQLGGKGGTEAEKGFLKNWNLVDPGKIKVNLLGGSGSNNGTSDDEKKNGGSWWNPFSWGKKSSGNRKVTPDNSSKGGPKTATAELLGEGTKIVKSRYTLDQMMGNTPIKQSATPVSPPNRPTTTVAYDNEMASQQNAMMPVSNMELPAINPSAMISHNKISTLGISV